LFGATANSVAYPDLPPLPIAHKLKLEHDLIGVYISSHPLDLYVGSNSMLNNRTTGLREGTEVTLMGLVKDFRKIVTRNGDDMAFMRLQDKYGDARIVIFPKLFEEKLRKKDVNTDDCVIIEGKYKEENVIAEDIKFPPMKKSAINPAM
jgi:DNA polymerase-3 subunit alpha